MWPYAVVPVEVFELLPNGKVNHNKVPSVDWAKLLEAAEPREGGYMAPANDLEQQLQRVWKQVGMGAAGPAPKAMTLLLVFSADSRRHV
jgi:hypothetical protein